MLCDILQQNVMNYLAGKLSEQQRQSFEAHIAECATCASEVREFRVVWNSLDTLEEQPVPRIVERDILRASREAVSSARENLWASSWLHLKALLKPMAPVALGLVAAMLSAGVLSTKMNLSLIHPLGLTAVGAVWTGLYGMIFYLLLSAGKKEVASWQDFARASIIAVAIFLGFTLISPVPNSISFCRYYSFTQPVIERLSVGGSFFLFGALYALIPMTVAVYVSGSRTGRHPLAKGSLTGSMFVALLAPSIYLQCAPFALGVLLVWFGGAFFGSVLGGALGYWIRYRLAGD